jgi:quercetin dioxygenase-like cupin family protein
MLSPMSSHVAWDEGAEGTHDLVPHTGSSPLSLSVRRLGAGESATIESAKGDTLLFAFEGAGTVRIGEDHDLAVGAAALALPPEAVELGAGPDGLAVVCAVVGEGCDLHAPMGEREVLVRLADADASTATGRRSFQVLFGPHNGSTRATLFVGHVPPGKAPRHYHLYDEIVWVLGGSGRLHLDGEEELGPGAAFRLSPRAVHIVENTMTDAALVVLGVFTPAGSPSAAYLEPGVATEYRLG